MGNFLFDIGIIGAGSWGTAIASLLSHNKHRITLWAYENEVCKHIANHRENHIYLPGIPIPDLVMPTQSFREACTNKDFLISAVPSHLTRPIMSKCAPCLDDRTIIVSLSKGIENETLKLMSGVFEDILPKNFYSQIAFLSGPSFATEVAQHLPTAVVVASVNQGIAEKVQQVFATSFFRVYTSNDIIGVELGGALKNVIAIAAGCADGLGFGHNTRAALITRGLAEILRLGIKAEANPLTFSGLSGLGDLVLTCTGALSRNRSVGIKLGEGMTLEKIVASSKMVAEGIKTTKSAFQLAQHLKVDMPIVEQVYKIIYHNKDPRQAVTDLMGRSLRYELDADLHNGNASILK